MAEKFIVELGNGGDIKAYIQQQPNGRFDLFLTVGNALPIRHGQYDSYGEAKEEAARQHAASCLLVR